MPPHPEPEVSIIKQYLLWKMRFGHKIAGLCMLQSTYVIKL